MPQAFTPAGPRSGVPGATDSAPLPAPAAAPAAHPPPAAEVRAFMKTTKPFLKSLWGPKPRLSGPKAVLDLIATLSESRTLALIVAANERDPAGPWCWALGIAFSRPPEGARAVEAFGLWQQAQTAVAAAAAASPGSLVLQHNLSVAETSLAHAALASGQPLDQVEVIARRLLARASSAGPGHWDFGNLIHNGHSLLGLAALGQDRLPEARAELLLAGQSPGSPQLDSFGPRFQLARRLLNHGQEADRLAVLAYLDEIAQFWASPGKEPDPLGQQQALQHRRDLEAWKEEIRSGRIPTDPRWR